MKRFLKRALAPVVVGAMLAGAAGPAVAAEDDEPIPQPTASSVGWEAQPGSLGLQIALPEGSAITSLDRLLCGLLCIFDPHATPITDLVEGIVNETVSPLLSGLTNVVTSAVVNPLLGVVAGGSATARTPPDLEARSGYVFPLKDGQSPTTNNPVSCTETSNTCYGSWLSTPDLDLGLAQLRLGAVSGLTEPVSTPEGWKLVAQSRVAGLHLGLLNVVDVLSLDSFRTSAECTVVGDDPPVAESPSMAISLLNSLVDIGLADETGALQVSVGGTPIVGLGAVDLSQLGADLGLLTDVTVDEHLARIGIGLDLNDLLAALDGSSGASGAGALSTLIHGLGLKSTEVKLVVEVSNENYVRGVEARATGLHVSLGLHLNLDVDLLGLSNLGLGLGAQIFTGNSIADSAGNLFTLDLAQASCASTATPGAEDSWIAPGLT